jgi:hypothetical protein
MCAEKVRLDATWLWVNGSDAGWQQERMHWAEVEGVMSPDHHYRYALGDVADAGNLTSSGTLCVLPRGYSRATTWSWRIMRDHRIGCRMCPSLLTALYWTSSTSQHFNPT